MRAAALGWAAFISDTCCSAYRLPAKREFGEFRSGERAMMNTFGAIGLGAVVALSPLAAVAQSVTPAQPMQVAQAAPAATSNSAHAGGGGSHRRHLRHSGNTHKERARAGAEHMRQMRMGTAPKS
jgi:hypothetical protein